MAETTKILAQALSKNAWTLLYAAPANGSAVISTFVACNIKGSATAFDMAVTLASATSVGNANYLYKNSALLTDTTLMATVGMTLGPGEKMYAKSTASSDVAFTVFGVERT